MQSTLHNTNTMTFPELIRGQEEVLRRVLQASERQITIVEQGNPTILIEHLGQRKRLWAEFEVLDEQLAPHKGIPPERRIWRNLEERHATEASLARCTILLSEIMTNDETSFAKAVEIKDEREKDLLRIRRGRNAVAGYARQG